MDFRHTPLQAHQRMDGRGRLALPPRLRAELGDRVIAARGQDRCLFIYSEAAWDAFEQKTAALPAPEARGLRRALFSGAASCEVDARGRIRIPDALREYAGLQKEVCIVGVSDHVEIWDAGQWLKYNEEAVAKAMDELGL